MHLVKQSRAAFKLCFSCLNNLFFILSILGVINNLLIISVYEARKKTREDSDRGIKVIISGASRALLVLFSTFRICGETFFDFRYFFWNVLRGFEVRDWLLDMILVISLLCIMR